MMENLTRLTDVEQKDVVAAVARTLSVETFFRMEPSGHTEYQLRNFLAHDCPTPDAKYRQYCRELWARVEAFQQLKFGIVESEIASRRLSAPWWNLAARWRARQEARRLELDKALYREALMRIDLKHRVVREIRVILDVLARFDESALERDRMKAEAAHWAKKAESIPELAAILKVPPATPATNGA